MELVKYLNKYIIIGVISNYKNSLKEDLLVKDLLNSKNNKDLLKFLNLSDNLLEKKINELSLSEKTKIDLLSKINNDIIIIGGFSNNLIYKDKELICKFLIKLNQRFNKKIIIIDSDISALMNICKYFIVLKDNKVLYKTNDVYDNKLYYYINKPEIVTFVQNARKKGILLDNYTDIYELLKAIYRSI